MEEGAPAGFQRPRKQRKLIGGLLLLSVGALIVTGLLFMKYRQAVNTNPTVQRNQLLSEVGSEVALPNETPTVSTIVDKSKITNAALAAQAQNGDKLLIYANAKRLILYRPVSHKVIDILDIQTPAPAPALTPTTKTNR